MSAPCLTVKDLSRRWNDEIRRGLVPSFGLFGDLLDDFRQRCRTSEEKLVLVGEAPEWIESAAHAEVNAYLASVAETLCREASLTPPAWTESPRCYLARPWFAGGLESLKAILLAESPVAFRRRNLFVSANALSRA
ncbi:MAG: hypothetical protein ACOYOL_12045 [Chthoniobacterales bacterium]